MSQKVVLRHQVYARQAAALAAVYSALWRRFAIPGDAALCWTDRTFYGRFLEAGWRRWTILSRRPDPIVSAVSKTMAKAVSAVSDLHREHPPTDAPRARSEPPALDSSGNSRPSWIRLSTVAKTFCGLSASLCPSRRPFRHVRRRDTAMRYETPLRPPL